MNLQGVKKKSRSKTIWGGAVAAATGAAGFAAPLLGWLVSGQAPADVTTIVQSVTSITGAVAGVVAIVGRITATKRVG